MVQTRSLLQVPVEAEGKDKDTSVSSQPLELSEREAVDKERVLLRGGLTSAVVIRRACACL